MSKLDSDATSAPRVAGALKDPVPGALITLREPSQRQHWERLLAARGITAHLLPAELPLDALTLNNPWLPAGALLILEPDVSGSRSFDLLSLVRTLAADRRMPRVVVSLSARLEVWPNERALLLGAGAMAVVPRLVSGSEHAVRELLAAARSVLPEAPETDVRTALSRTSRSTLPDACDVFVSRDVDPVALAERMRASDGVARAERRHGLHSYPDCFVGREASDWLAREIGGAREDAVLAGEALRGLGVFHHVVKEQPFRDGHFFYRFAQMTPALEAIDLATLIERMRARGGRDLRKSVAYREAQPALAAAAATA